MEDPERVAEFLTSVPLFRSLKRRQIERLAVRFVRRKYAAGQDIVVQGQSGIGLFILVSGKAEAIRVHTDGTKMVVNTFGPTDFFGELALLDDAPRTASVVATADCECLALTQWEFLSALREDADMAIVILQEMARRFRRTLNTF
jgi:CRP/FNR family transcriptional regulator